MARPGSRLSRAVAYSNQQILLALDTALDALREFDDLQRIQRNRRTGWRSDEYCFAYLVLNHLRRQHSDSPTQEPQAPSEAEPESQPDEDDDHDDHEPLTLTVGQAAQVLGVGRNSAYNAIKAGTIPAIRIGKVYRVPTAALKKMLE